MLRSTVPVTRHDTEGVHSGETHSPTGGGVGRAHRSEVLVAVYLVAAAVAMWAAYLTGTVMVVLFAQAQVVLLWLLGGVVAVPAVSLMMRGASQRLADALTTTRR